MRKVVAISEFAEERDREECVSLYQTADGSSRDLALWLINHCTYPNTRVAEWCGCSEGKIRYLRKWANGGFVGNSSDSSVVKSTNAPLKTNDNFQDDGPAADQDDPDAPGVDAHTLKNILDSISQAKAVAEAWRKIVKASSFDSGEKAEIYNAINKLIVKWRTVQSTLDRKGQGNAKN